MFTMWLRTLAPSSALTFPAFALFLLNSAIAMRRALGRGDARVAAFVAAATVLLAALLATVRAHERAREEMRRRGRGLLMFKAAAWAQSAALTAIFAHRVAGVLAPQAPAMACVVWTMAGSTMAGGFYCLFLLRGRDDDTDELAAGGHDAARQA